MTKQVQAKSLKGQGQQAGRGKRALKVSAGSAVKSDKNDLANKPSVAGNRKPVRVPSILRRIELAKLNRIEAVTSLANEWAVKYAEALAGIASSQRTAGGKAMKSLQDTRDAIGLLNAKELKESKNGGILSMEKMAGILNIGKIEQRRSSNVATGYSGFIGVLNTGSINQEGKLNLLTGTGGLLGILNLGIIKAQGTSLLVGLSTGVGIINAGTIALVDGASETIGAGSLTGIVNLGTITTGDNGDLIVGISSGAGIINGLAPELAPALGTNPDIAVNAVINTGSGDDLVAGSGLYNLPRFLSRRTTVLADYKSFDKVNSLADILANELINTLNLELGVNLNPFLQSDTYVPFVQNSQWEISGSPTDDSATANALLDKAKDATFGILNFGTIDVGSGEDTIFGAADDIYDVATGNYLEGFKHYIGSGILNASNGTILLGEGDDSLVGETWSISVAADPLAPPAGLVNIGTIDSGEGNDLLSGYAFKIGNGIENLGIITSGSGDDSISGRKENSTQGTGLYNSGIIRTGTGKDTVSGKDGAYGIFNVSGRIETEEGSDTINGIGSIVGINNNSAISTGTDEDTISGKGGEYGIFTDALASIDTGEGNDTIIGEGSIGIFNSGNITTGDGDDTVDALTGGFSGSGNTYLGEGNDTLIGFGTGRFDGGAGIKDSILLSDGTYTYSGFGPVGNEANEKGYFKLTKGNAEMLIQNIEFIGSAHNPYNTIQLNLGFMYNIAGNTITANLLLF